MSTIDPEPVDIFVYEEPENCCCIYEPTKKQYVYVHSMGMVEPFDPSKPFSYEQAIKRSQENFDARLCYVARFHSLDPEDFRLNIEKIVGHGIPEDEGLALTYDLIVKVNKAIKEVLFKQNT